MKSVARLCVVAFLTAFVPVVHAQTATCDPNQPVLVGIFGWPKNASVTVYVDPGLQSGEGGGISTAFSNWTNAGNSGVHFTIIYNAGSAANPPSGSIGLVSGPVEGPDQANANTTATSDGRTQKSRITVEPSVTGAAFTRLLAHEIGHSFGLADWTSQTDSIMAKPVQATTPPTPNACDKNVVKLNGNYGSGGTGPGGTGSPTGCTLCAYKNCWEITRTRNGDIERVTECVDYQACCKKTALDAGETFQCETWIPRSGPSCLNDGECCQNPQDNAPASCESIGMFSDQQSCVGANGFCVLQEAVSVSAEVGNMTCWDGAPPPTPTCGGMGGEYCSQAAGWCPGGYDSLGQSSDCQTCCNQTIGDGYCEPGVEDCGTSPSDCPCWMAGTTCNASGSPGQCVDRCSDPAYHNHTGSCGQADECGHPIGTAQECLPSCGAMGGDYCSQSGGWCPGGYDNLGQSNDCQACCQLDPCASPYTHDHGGSCGSADSCGHSFGASEDCGCPGAPTVYDTCWDYRCDTGWSWVPQYCDTCEQQCTTEWSCSTNCDEWGCWDECQPYDSCWNNCYSYECGGYWGPYDYNCRWEPYQCNPHQCGN